MGSLVLHCATKGNETDVKNVILEPLDLVDRALNHPEISHQDTHVFSKN